MAFQVYNSSGQELRSLTGTAGGDLTGTYPNPTISGQVLRTDKVLHVRDEQTASTLGGTFTSGSYQTRTLNTVKTNTISGASVSSNQITLPAGTYWVEGSAPAFRVEEHRTRLYNTTTSAELIGGTTEYTRNSTDYAGNRSFIRGQITLSAQSVLEFQHRGTVTQALNGFGNATTFDTQVYADLVIWKVA